MNKQVKTALIIVGLAAAVFLLVSWKKPEIKPLTQSEKDQLFSDGMGYRGGAAPSPEIEEEAKKRQEEAIKKIAELGLQTEFEAYKASQEQLPDLPSSAPLMPSSEIISNTEYQ